MNPSNVNSASLFFNENWQWYLCIVRNNTLFHREMLSAVKQFILMHIGDRPISFVDAGCGDGGTVAPMLADVKMHKYIGIDAAEDVLKMATTVLGDLHCEKEFITDDFVTGIPHLSEAVDIIYTSYAVHHLSLEKKIHFIASCRKKLKPNGFLLMVDLVHEPNQTRNDWLEALKFRLKEADPSASEEEIAFRMEHPTQDDFPETIETFAKIAKKQSWSNFQTVIDKGIFAFMVFMK